jgi:hypothetical protein
MPHRAGRFCFVASAPKTPLVLRNQNQPRSRNGLTQKNRSRLQAHLLSRDTDDDLTILKIDGLFGELHFEITPDALVVDLLQFLQVALDVGDLVANLPPTRLSEVETRRHRAIRVFLMRELSGVAVLEVNFPEREDQVRPESLALDGDE